MARRSWHGLCCDLASDTSVSFTVVRTSFGPQQLTGVTWRLDHVVKSRHLDGEQRPLFFVRVLTVQQDGGEGKIDMTCTVEQLQDLYARLGDAARQIERTLNQSQ